MRIDEMELDPLFFKVGDEFFPQRFEDRALLTYGKIDIVYGSRSMQDLVDYNEIIDEIVQEPNLEENNSTEVIEETVNST